MLSHFHLHSSLISFPHLSSCLSLCLSLCLCHSRLHIYIYIYRFLPPYICPTSLLSLFSLSHTHTYILYFLLFTTTFSCSVCFLTFCHTYIFYISNLPFSFHIPTHIPLFICPPVHISPQTWHARHKGPFQSDYFGQVPEFVIFFPLRSRCPASPSTPITHSAFYRSTFIFKNASKLPLHWRSRPFSPMPSGRG